MRDALADACIAPLEAGTKLGADLRPAPDAMVRALLNGKDADLLRHPNSKILVVAYHSQDTCEVMALGIDMQDIADAVEGWAEGAGYTMDPDANMQSPTGGGAYLVRAVEPGYVQIFVHTDAPRGFAGLTASRVKASAQAREILGQ